MTKRKEERATRCFIIFRDLMTETLGGQDTMGTRK